LTNGGEPSGVATAHRLRFGLPEVGIYSLADFFLTHHERRLPVIENGRLVGLVCRRDVLKGIRQMIRKRQLPTPAEQRGPKLYPSATDASADALGNRLR